MSFTGSFLSYDETLGSGSFIVEGVDLYVSQSAKIQNILGTNPALEVTGAIVTTDGIYAQGGFTGSFSGSFIGFINSASLAQTASYVNIVAGPNITVNFENGGISVSGSSGGGGGFPFTGSAGITGSLNVVGSQTFKGSSTLGAGPTVTSTTFYSSIPDNATTSVWATNNINEVFAFVKYFMTSNNLVESGIFPLVTNGITATANVFATPGIAGSGGGPAGSITIVPKTTGTLGFDVTTSGLGSTADFYFVIESM